METTKELNEVNKAIRDLTLDIATEIAFKMLFAENLGIDIQDLIRMLDSKKKVGYVKEEVTRIANDCIAILNKLNKHKP